MLFLHTQPTLLRSVFHAMLYIVALQRPYLGPKGQPTWVKRASAPGFARAVSSTFADRTLPPVAHTDEPNGFLACQGSRPSALLAACPCWRWCALFKQGDPQTATKERTGKWAQRMQSVMPYLQEDFLVANKATWRTRDTRHHKAANLVAWLK